MTKRRTMMAMAVVILMGSINSTLNAETTKVSPLKYVGSYGKHIQVYDESVFDVILEKFFDKKTLLKIDPFKPKKNIENEILNQIKAELDEYNLSFGDLFICKISTEDKNIVALVLIYGTLEPTIRYYHIKQ
ncbi:MAG: hypothetical protein F9K24_18605 [Leptonema illini]|jgi:hypothetical protein|uniref:Uncharacterized protein n=1 Tax=Leptonema illini TaxID=183 RepID=A0A833GYF7_9LEPT|nr:MAG: hypothetical protein F9K24_18605 [Leptonema illini]